MGQNKSLLYRYYLQGWLARRYFDGTTYHQPYSERDRLTAGELFYADYLKWNNTTLQSRDYAKPLVDGAHPYVAVGISSDAERFRRALRLFSKPLLSVVYKIVLEDNEIKMPHAMSEREKLYFNDEIKRLLCRGLDILCGYYNRG